jgi:formylglycine-generating enzyme required for sulfatase activity
MQHEKPAHLVAVDGFFMDASEVTNAQFKKFIEETGYVTVAEREIVWEEMKKQLPPGTPKPHDSILQPGSLVFKKTTESVPNLYDYSQLWDWIVGANWKQPEGKLRLNLFLQINSDSMIWQEMSGNGPRIGIM